MLTARMLLIQVITSQRSIGRSLMHISKNYKELLKPNDNEKDWTIAEMNEAIKRGYLLYYWSIYKQTEEDRRKAA